MENGAHRGVKAARVTAALHALRDAHTQDSQPRRSRILLAMSKRELEPLLPVQPQQNSGGTVAVVLLLLPVLGGRSAVPGTF